MKNRNAVQSRSFNELVSNNSLLNASTDYAYILSVGLSVYKNVTKAATASSI